MTESSNIVLEWRNIKTIISQAADESLRKYKAFTLKKKLKIWDNKINCATEKFSIQEGSSKKTIDNETEYKLRRAIAKTESGKDITDPENNLYHT
jgi:hypothetical protein